MKQLNFSHALSLLALATFSSTAVELYSDDNTDLTMYGAIAAHLSSYHYDPESPMGSGDAIGYESGNLYIEDPGSWIGFDITHTLGDYRAIVKLEYDVNFGTQSDESDVALAQRQTYVGFGHTTYGDITIGRQESPYVKSDVGYYAYFAGGLNMMQSDQLGSRRTKNTLIWKKETDNFYIGLQYQAKRSEDHIGFGNRLNFGAFLPAVSDEITIDSGFGAATTYTTSLGTYFVAAYNQANDISGKVIDLLGDANQEITLNNANIKQLALGVEQHFLDGDASLSARFERFEARNGTGGTDLNTTTDNFGLGANLYVSDSVRIYGGYEFGIERDNTTNAVATKTSMFNLGTAWAPVPWGELYLESYSDAVTLNNSTNWVTGGVHDYYGRNTHFFLGAAVFF
ncbi:porin [Vibrio sp. ZSDZ65]|uniref:Porin n=1 Tax=Vibrio qingdaonensis TaxID=2829491 RepID=A0A9X3CMV3_9VIBR|nr:porin [Vibrio qingdaonensis]MCW8345375.1 porin [Vibrio qingdaonensis]